MTDNKQVKEDLLVIQKGLFKIGRHRVVALPAHTTWDLIDDLEVRIARLIEVLEVSEIS